MPTQPPPDAAPQGLLRWNLGALTLYPGELPPPSDIRTLIRSTEQLPPLPEIALRLLRLLDDPDADAVRLAGILELDPLITAQVLRRANSAYYVSRDPVTSVRDAVGRVLGFETALSLALGLAMTEPLRVPPGGPLGREEVWRHGLLCGQLTQTLAAALPPARRPASGQAQLAGILQNIGYLLLGHLLPDPYRFLNRMVLANPALPLPALERFSLGLEHGQLGAWLLEAWGLPAPLCAAVRHHHTPGYTGAGADLVRLSGLADALLTARGLGIGPVPDDEAMTRWHQALGLSPETTEARLAGLLERVMPQ